jgi:hypothetical protein
MMVRKPAVAGSFYPVAPETLKNDLARFVVPTEEKIQALGAVVPHAGYIYSGSVAGAVYSRIEIPPTVVILAPNHHGMGAPFALWAEGSWQTPLGQCPIDEDFARLLLYNCPPVEADNSAHRFEHSAEVQLPFLQHINPEVKIVPLVLSSHHLPSLEELGRGLAASARDLKTRALILASSDMTHYESQKSAQEKDDAAIQRILALDAEGLLKTVEARGISMCGVAPAVAMLSAAKEMGASSAELIKYQTSGDVTQDRSQVVGYAGIIVR